MAAQNPQTAAAAIDPSIGATGTETTEAAAESKRASSPLSMDEIPLPPVGSSADVLVEHLKVLAEQAPERVADVIKPWIRKHG